MSDKKNRNDQKSSADSKPVNTNRNAESASDKTSNEINKGNLVNSGKIKSRRELHTKTGVSGSDSDGQAD